MCLYCFIFDMSFSDYRSTMVPCVLFQIITVFNNLPAHYFAASLFHYVSLHNVSFSLKYQSFLLVPRWKIVTAPRDITLCVIISLMLPYVDQITDLAPRKAAIILGLSTGSKQGLPSKDLNVMANKQCAWCGILCRKLRITGHVNQSLKGP